MCTSCMIIIGSVWHTPSFRQWPSSALKARWNTDECRWGLRRGYNSSPTSKGPCSSGQPPALPALHGALTNSILNDTGLPSSTFILNSLRIRLSCLSDSQHGIWENLATADYFHYSQLAASLIWAHFRISGSGSVDFYHFRRCLFPANRPPLSVSSTFARLGAIPPGSFMSSSCKFQSQIVRISYHF